MLDRLVEAGLLSDRMETTQEFHVTEAGMRAVLETMTTMSHAITELSRQCEAANEAIVILAHEVDDMRTNTSRGYIPGGYTPA